MHVLRLALGIYKGDYSAAAPRGKRKPRFLPCLAQQALVRAFVGLEFSADADPFIVIYVVFLLHAVQHEIFAAAAYVTKSCIEHYKPSFM